MFRARLTPAYGDVIGWVRGLPGPCAAAHEAGPTGFDLYRALTGAGVRCESRRHPSCTARTGTESRPMPGMRCIRPGCYAWMRSRCGSRPRLRRPAQDLVRAREAARADLMRSRHHLSKLLLRHGIAYSGSKAWKIAHDTWLLRQHFDRASIEAAFEDAYEAVVLAAGRRHRLEHARRTQPPSAPFRT